MTTTMTSLVTDDGGDNDYIDLPGQQGQMATTTTSCDRSTTVMTTLPISTRQRRPSPSPHIITVYASTVNKSEVDDGDFFPFFY